MKRSKSQQVLFSSAALSLFAAPSMVNQNEPKFTIVDTLKKRKRSLNSYSFNDLLNVTKKSSKQEQMYSVYLIRVERPATRRQWCVTRRYSEFHDLHKFLQKRYENESDSKKLRLPSLPPKLVFGNMKEENITKRMMGLQTFLDGIAKHEEFFTNSEVVEFFNFHMDTRGIYLVSDSVHRKIFQYLSFTDIFPNLTMVCRWWKEIIYGSFQNVRMIFVNKNIFFGTIPVNIDLIGEVVTMVSNFKMITLLRLDNFYPLNDEMLDIILKNCRRIEDLTLVSCGLQTPVIPLQSSAFSSSANNMLSPRDMLSPISLLLTFPSATSATSAVSTPRSRSNSATSGFLKQLNLSYCEIMRSVTFSSMSELYEENLVNLTLTGTMVDDAALQSILKYLHNLKTLEMRESIHLISPEIVSDTLKSLNLRFCRNLTSPVLKCPRLELLDLAFTAITDEVITNSLTEDRTSACLHTLYLSNCRELNNPQIVSRAISEEHEQTNVPNEAEQQAMTEADQFTSFEMLEELYLDCCPRLAQPVISIPSLKKIDLRITRHLAPTVVEDVQQHCPNLTQLLN